MSKPKECPKCKASSDEVNNAHDMCDFLGLNLADVKKWMCGKCDYFFDDDEAVLESWYDNADFSKMKLNQIADVIIDDWESKLSPKAWPYVEAMMSLDSIDDECGQDSAESVVAYFLANAKQWRGPIAQKVKQYLRGLLAKKQLNNL